MIVISRLFFTAALVLCVQASAGAAEPEPGDPSRSNTRIYDRASIDASGWLTLGDFLANLSQTGTAQSRGTNASGNGEQTVNLYNLGANRTLVLLNGRRLVAGTRSSVDLSTYPLSAVERIEVSSSGNSAALGSGAVAGTVNLVTRYSQEGLQVAGQIGQFDDGDGRSEHLDLGYGQSFEGGSFYLNASYLNADPVIGGERDISASRPFGSGTAAGSSATPQGRFGSLLLGSYGLTTDPGTVVDGPEDFRQGDFSSGLPGAGADRFNNAAEEFVLHQRERQSILASTRWSLTDALQLEVDALYSRRDATVQFAPPALFLGLFGIGDIAAPTVAADNAFNPFDQAFPGDTYLLARRLSEAGNHRFQQQAQEYRLAGALRGSLELAGQPWQWRAQWAHSRQDSDENRPFQINYDRVAQALSGQPCRDDAFGDGCVELNVFGGQGADGLGTISPAMLQYITFDATDRLSSEMNQLSLDLSSTGPTLGGGDVAFGLGLDWRSEQLQRRFGPTATDNLFSQNFSGSESTDILAATAFAQLPFSETLSGNLAARYADANAFDSVFAASAALGFAANDALSFRLEGSRDYVLPNQNQLLDSRLQGTIQVADACASNQSLAGCSSATGDSPSAGAEAEIAQQWHLGVYWQPRDRNLKTRAEYRQVSIDEVLTNLNAQQLVTACSFAARHCQLVSRSVVGGVVQESTAPLIATVNDGQVDMDTLDLGVDWSSESGSWWLSLQTQYVINFDRTTPRYLLSFTGTVAPIIEPVQESDLGEVNGVNLIPRVRANLDAGWSTGNWRGGWATRYTHGVTEQCRQQAFGLCNLDLNGNGELDGRGLGSTTYHDAQLSYDFPAYGTSLTVGVQNLLDKNPPLSSAAPGNYYTNDYRTPGRYPYVRVAVTF